MTTPKNHLYVFYRPLNTTSAQVLCDIVDVSTGIAVMTQIELASVGSYNYMEPYWCSFDGEKRSFTLCLGNRNNLRQFLQYTGWLYGASVSTKRSCLDRKRLSPTAQYNPCYSQLYAGDELPSPIFAARAGQWLALSGNFQDIIFCCGTDGRHLGQRKNQDELYPSPSRYELWNSIFTEPVLFQTDTGILALSGIPFSGTERSTLSVRSLTSSWARFFSLLYAKQGLPYTLYSATLSEHFSYLPTPVQ